MDNNSYSVSEVTNYINNLLSKDINLSAIYVQGEISNLKMHSSKHIYFTLKDKDASIKCIMFANYSSTLDFVLENGMQVIVFGKISVFKKAGTYQLYASQITSIGSGDLFLKFEKLKKDLHKEGLFKEENKRLLPLYPSRIVVVTSKTSAALQDFLNVAKRRSRFVELYIYNVLVQGEKSAKEIASAIEYINCNVACDVIVLTRGGGSIEDLWPFNEEMTARAIYKSNIPVVSAIGHETDYTISDMVADLRAPTPSAAAELVVPNSQKILIEINSLKNRIVNLMYQKMQKEESSLKIIESKYNIDKFHEFISLKHERLDYILENLNKSIDYIIKNNIEKLNGLERNLNNTAPSKVLERGYTYVFDDNNKLIKSIKKISKDDIISVYFKDGKITTKVREVLDNE